MNILYNVFLFVLSIVTLCTKWGRVKRGGVFFLLSKLGLKLKDIKIENKKRVWIHAVSLGEIKSSQILIEQYRAMGYQVIVSTNSDTGFCWAKKKDGIQVFYLPIDFSYIMKKFMRKLKPEKLILVEGDIWPQMIRFAKKQGAYCTVVSANISLTSMKKFMHFPLIAQFLFKDIDLLETQNALYKDRFEKLTLSGPCLSVGRNLKFAYLNQIPNVRPPDIKRQKGVIMLSCTHDGEEELLLDRLKRFMGQYTFVIAPRHPERFTAVYRLLEPYGVQKISENNKLCSPCILVDEMGVLENYYAVADCIVMGGSFVKGVGGHNLLEPLKFHKYLFFGPYMYKQKEIVSYAKTFDNCYQCTLDALADSICKILHKNPCAKIC